MLWALVPPLAVDCGLLWKLLSAGPAREGQCSPRPRIAALAALLFSKYVVLISSCAIVVVVIDGNRPELSWTMERQFTHRLPFQLSLCMPEWTTGVASPISWLTRAGPRNSSGERPRGARGHHFHPRGPSGVWRPRGRVAAFVESRQSAALGRTSRAR